MTELPSDRMVRRMYRWSMNAVGVACLLWGTLAFLDSRAGQAAAGAAVGLAWIIAGRLLAPP
jgi:uncharacterized membrane protein HdeD (DUF308 family)